MKKLVTARLIYFFLLGTFWGGTAWAIPNTMKFQGRLTDSQGRPIDGTPQIRFEIYDAATNGSRIWGPSTYVTVKSNEAGLFSADIDMGPNGADKLGTSSELYLQITVKAGTERIAQILSPRQQLSSVPFAFFTQVAASATVASSVSNNSITSDAVSDGAISRDKLSFDVRQSFVPSGMIAMFSGQCPSGWDPFTDMAGRFPLAPGGMLNKPLDTFSDTASHRHNMEHSHDMAHSHPIAHRHHYAGTTGGVSSFNVNSGASNGDAARYPHTHSYDGFTESQIQIGGSATADSGPSSLSHTGVSNIDASSEVDHVPPYYVVLFCVKK